MRGSRGSPLGVVADWSGVRDDRLSTVAEKTEEVVKIIKTIMVMVRTIVCFVFRLFVCGIVLLKVGN